MLRSQTANLSPEQQQRLHADFIANEQAYLRMRDSLLPTHRGQWVGHDAEAAAGVPLGEPVDDRPGWVERDAGHGRRPLRRGW